MIYFIFCVLLLISLIDFKYKNLFSISACVGIIINYFNDSNSSFIELCIVLFLCLMCIAIDFKIINNNFKWDKLNVEK